MRGLERKAFGCLGITVYFVGLGYAESHVVAYVDGEDLIAQDMSDLAAAAKHQNDDACSHHGTSRAQHRAARAGGQGDAAAYVYGGNGQKRYVYNAYDNHRRIYVAEQFRRLTRVCSGEIEEHVGGDDRVAEQIRQYDLEGAEEYEYHSAPHHHTRTACQRGESRVCAQREQYACQGLPQRVLLGIGQNQHRQHECRYISGGESLGVVYYVVFHLHPCVKTLR